jgi:uncharacterized Fe-S center protein
MLVGHMMIYSRTLFDLNYTEFLNDRMNKDLQNKKLVREHDFVPVKITEEIVTSNALLVMSIFVNHMARLSITINSRSPAALILM